MMLTHTLRAYVRHAELYGGYDSVFEEAAKDLSPVDLAYLCMAMRGLSHEYRVKRSNGQYRTVTETFKLGSSEREALVWAPARQPPLFKLGGLEANISAEPHVRDAVVTGVGGHPARPHAEQLGRALGIKKRTLNAASGRQRMMTAWRPCSKPRRSC
jgi:hypothetical protein